MFDAYTEKARRAIFEGRREASKLGGNSLEIAHLVLGMLEADRPLAVSLLKSEEKVEALRQQIIKAVPRNQAQTAPGVDLPLSHGCKLVLAHAAEQSQRLSHGYISVEHLFLGVLREDSSTARILLEGGITVAQLEAEARISPKVSPRTHSVDGFHDLVAEYRQGNSQPLIGREKELDQMLQILSRQSRNSVVLIGEAGVGKDALVRGLAQRMADGFVPEELAERQILQLNVSQLQTVRLSGFPILYIRGLFDSRLPLPSWLAEERFQIIATGSPLPFRLALDRDDTLARRFELVSVLAPGEEDALLMVHGRKATFEQFHSVAIADEAVELAVTASGRFLRSRALPDRALDLLDEASARVKLRLDRVPPDLARIKARIRTLAKAIDYETSNHHLDKVCRLAEEKRQHEEKLNVIQLEQQGQKPDRTVRPEDILDVLSTRTGLSVDAVKATLARPQESDFRSLLAARLPAGRRDWIDGLLSYLTDCSPDDADHLLEAIQKIRKTI